MSQGMDLKGVVLGNICIISNGHQSYDSKAFDVCLSACNLVRLNNAGMLLGVEW
jgi:hypothetical protein